MRVSPWQQFASNFAAMNQTFDGAFRDFEVKRINRREYAGEDGAPLEGDALRSARAEDIAAVMEKYGDPEGAARLRAAGEQLRGLRLQNRIGEATEADQIYVRGIGARRNLDAGIAATRAAASASRASAGLSGARADATRAAAAFDASTEGIRRDRLAADARAAGLQAQFEEQTLDARVEAEELERRRLAAENDRLDRLNRIAAATEGAQIHIQGDGAVAAHEAGLGETEARTAGLAAAAAAAEWRLEGDKALSAVFSEAAGREGAGDEEETEWMIGRVMGDEGIPGPVRLEVAALLRAHGSSAVEAEMSKLARGVEQAARGGLSGLADFYNAEVADGAMLRIDRSQEGRVLAWLETPDGERSLIASGEGEDAEAQAMAMVARFATSPTTMMDAAADNMAHRFEAGRLEQQGADLQATRAATREAGARTELHKARAEALARDALATRGGGGVGVAEAAEMFEPTFRAMIADGASEEEIDAVYAHFNRILGRGDDAGWSIVEVGEE